MENKELTRRQARDLTMLPEFNFQLIFRRGKRNRLAEVLTCIFDVCFIDQVSDKKLQKQVILTSNQVCICSTKVEETIFRKRLLANQKNDFYPEFHEVLAANKDRLYGVGLGVCKHWIVSYSKMIFLRSLTACIKSFCKRFTNNHLLVTLLSYGLLIQCVDTFNDLDMSPPYINTLSIASNDSKTKLLKKKKQNFLLVFYLPTTVAKDRISLHL